MRKNIEISIKGRIMNLMLRLLALQ